jgi:hypothetical protein
MNARGVLTTVGVFLAVVVLVVGATATGAVLSSPSTPAEDAGMPDSFEPGSVSVETPEEGGEVTVDSDSTGDVVVLDLVHGSQPAAEQVQTLERLLVEHGYRVRYHGTPSSGGSSGGLLSGLGLGGASSSGAVSVSGSAQSPELNRSLSNADAYVLINPTEPLDAGESAAVETFADAGGRVLVMTDPKGTSIAGLLGGAGDPPSPGAETLSRFGVGAGSGYLYDMVNDGTNFQTVAASGSGSLGQGVGEVRLHRATPVVAGPEATVALRTGPETELSDAGRTGGSRYPVAARNGNVAIVGDTSVLAPSNLRTADNEVLVGNLVEFLVDGSTVGSAPFETEGPTRPPTTGPGGPPTPPGG